MTVSLDPPCAPREHWEMSALVVASNPLPLTLVLQRGFPTPPACKNLEALAVSIKEDSGGD